MRFDAVPLAPQDAILGLNDAFRKDANPAKINLGVGVYKDATGTTPIMKCVKIAEEQIFHRESTKDYLSIEGTEEYGRLVQQLLLGAGHEIVAARRLSTVHTPGGTGALRVAADFLKKLFPSAAVWLSDPTWPNHPSVFQSAGLAVKTYAYFDPQTNGLAFDKMLKAIAEIPAGDVILLHGCCHNPTGIDPTAEQWAQIADVVTQRKLLPLIDFAYQGLAEGIQEDTVGLLQLARPGAELLVASSFSKNFGLYNERVGALTAVAATPQAAEAVLSQLKTCVRANYSNPPAHGASIVSTVLGNADLRRQWEQEVREIRERIDSMRTLFVKTLTAKGVDRDFTFISRQRGMFSFSGLTADQVKKLRDDDSIYAVSSGRINVAGMTESNMDALCSAIARVLAS